MLSSSLQKRKRTKNSMKKLVFDFVGTFIESILFHTDNEPDYQMLGGVDSTKMVKFSFISLTIMISNYNSVAN